MKKHPDSCKLEMAENRRMYKLELDRRLRSGEKGANDKDAWKFFEAYYPLAKDDPAIYPSVTAAAGTSNNYSTRSRPPTTTNPRKRAPTLAERQVMALETVAKSSESSNHFRNAILSKYRISMPNKKDFETTASSEEDDPGFV